MAKALIGHVTTGARPSGPHAGSLVSENARLRTRVAELEALVLRLSEDHDRLVAARAEELLERSLEQMQPA